jgi:hypothetical protein
VEISFIGRDLPGLDELRRQNRNLLIA